MRNLENQIGDSKRGKFAVVTGASSGIGYELAKVFARNGFDLLIAAENDAIIDIAEEMKTLGGKVESLQVDLANYDGVELLYEKILEQGRNLDAIAINAGVGVGGDFTRQTKLEDELNLIQLNVVSTVQLAKRVVKDMVEVGEGRVLFTSSVVSQMPGPFEAIYAASKAFVQSFAEALRSELEDTGVTVTSLMPGATETNFFHRAGMDNTKVGHTKKDSAAQVAQQGYDALMAGKDHVVGGSFKNKVQVTIAKILPEKIKAGIHRDMARPENAPQNIHKNIPKIIKVSKNKRAA
jgi:short-subunit dehydrogenase